MKLTEAQKKRLAFLLSKKSAGDITEVETSELSALETLASSDETIKSLDEAFINEWSESTEEIEEEQLKGLISEATAKALKDNKLDDAALLSKVKEAGAKTVEEVKSILAEEVKGADVDEIGRIVAKQVEKAKGLSADDVKSILKEGLEEFSKKQKGEQKMRFEAEKNAHFPVTHRSGNLTVADAQLLNICKMNSRNQDMDKPQSMNEGIPAEAIAGAKSSGAKQARLIQDQARYGAKALTTSGANSGIELIPTDLSSELQMRLYLESQLAASLISREVQMPTDAYELPLKTTRTAFQLGSEAPASEPSRGNPSTDKVILSAKKLIGVAEYSYEADEDAILPLIPMLQADLAEGAAAAFESAVINGDTAGAQDSDYSAATHPSRLFDGLRKYAIDGAGDATVANSPIAVDLTAGGLSAANIAAMRKAMGKYGIRPSDLRLVCGVKGYNDIVSLDETLSYDKVGNPNAARILSGVSDSVWGIPVITSELLREDLNASAAYDGVTTDLGSVFLIHVPSWMVGVRRGFTVEVEQDRFRQTNQIIASFRRDFVSKEKPSGTVPSVVMGYNYTS